MEQQIPVERVAGARNFGRMVVGWTSGTAKFARQKPLGFFGVAICALTLILALFPGTFGRYDPNFEQDFRERLAPPSAAHWFGTDNYGLDVYSRIVHGTRISWQVAVFSVGVGTTIGFLLGIVSGYFGGRVDLLLQRVTEAMMAFPPILLAMAIVAVLGSGLDKVIIAISITRVPATLRVIRGVVLSVKENPYVDAARVIGASPPRIMLRHILPNVTAPYLVLASLGLGAAILTEASLSYLGLGVPPPYPSWGRMLSGSSQLYAMVAPWMVIFPGLAISVLVLGFNIFGDALRDIWDPRLRGR